MIKVGLWRDVSSNFRALRSGPTWGFCSKAPAATEWRAAHERSKIKYARVLRTSRNCQAPLSTYRWCRPPGRLAAPAGILPHELATWRLTCAQQSQFNLQFFNALHECYTTAAQEPSLPPHSATAAFKRPPCMMGACAGVR